MENRILVAHKNGVPPICFKQISRSLFPWQQDQSISAEISQRWDLFQYLYRISLSNISLSKDCVHHETEKKKKTGRIPVLLFTLYKSCNAGRWRLKVSGGSTGQSLIFGIRAKAWTPHRWCNSPSLCCCGRLWTPILKQYSRSTNKLQQQQWLQKQNTQTTRQTTCCFRK